MLIYNNFILFLGFLHAQAECLGRKGSSGVEELYPNHQIQPKLCLAPTKLYLEET